MRPDHAVCVAHLVCLFQLSLPRTLGQQVGQKLINELTFRLEKLSSVTVSW